MTNPVVFAALSIVLVDERIVLLEDLKPLLELIDIIVDDSKLTKMLYISKLLLLKRRHRRRVDSKKCKSGKWLHLLL